MVSDPFGNARDEPAGLPDSPRFTSPVSGAESGPSGRFRPVGASETARANRAWWEAEAEAYLAEHGDQLAGRFLWGPEGLDESAAHLLGDVVGRDVLEVGTGAAQCAAWLAGQGARVVGIDLSLAMLRHGPRDIPRVQSDARALPFPAGSFDIACSAYGAVPFVADPERVFAQVARVLRPGGRWVFAVTHPIRWAFLDDGGPRGLHVVRSYFDRTPYVEYGDDGRLAYAEHHRTIGDRVRDLVGAGFRVEDVVEPEWPAGRAESWGAWTPLRGRLIPGTIIFVCRRP